MYLLRLITNIFQDFDNIVELKGDFDPPHLRCALESIDELHRAAERGEKEDVRRRACADKIGDTVPLCLLELTEVAVYLGHSELLLVLQEKMC